MRMRLVTVFFLFQIYPQSFSINADFISSPECFIKNKEVEKPCAYFKERPIEMLSEESWTEQAIIKTEGSQNYINITVLIDRMNEINSLLVMIQYDDFPFPEKTWEIQPIGREFIEFPCNLTIAFAPIRNSSTRYRMRRIVNPNKLFDDPACNKTETTGECSNLQNSKLFMRKAFRNSLSVTMSSEIASSSLAVEVLSAHCNITCRGDINPCSGIEIRKLYWENPTEELKIDNSENSTENTYYCARISPAYHDCCMIYTETILLSLDYPQKISVTFGQKIYLPESLMVLFISVTLLASAFLAIRKIFRENNIECCHYRKIQPPECNEDIDLIDSIGEEVTPTKVNSTPAHVFQQPVEILLIYPRKSETLEKLMFKFGHIISFYVHKVWDPLDEQEIEKVSENPIIWLETFLHRNNVKVILVEDSSTTEWYESCFQGHQTLHHHHLDSLFMYAVNVLHNSPYLSHNYRRIFIIRFASIINHIKSTNIVPCTRYEIPQNFNSLINDLVGLNGTSTNTKFQPPISEMEELNSLIFEYQQEKMHQEDSAKKRSLAM